MSPPWARAISLCGREPETGAVRSAPRLGTASESVEQARDKLAVDAFPPILDGETEVRIARRVGARRCRRAAAALATLAVAIARRDERLRNLEPDRPAVAAAGQRQLSHRPGA